jgi:hypothetical protein
MIFNFAIIWAWPSGIDAQAWAEIRAVEVEKDFHGLEPFCGGAANEDERGLKKRSLILKRHGNRA